MNKSYLIAFAVALAAGGWILSGQIGERAPPARADAGMAEAAPPRAVRVETFAARPLRRDIIVRGRTEVSRRVTLRAETAGRIARVLVDEGARVATGDVIARLETADREAQLAEAKALQHQREIEYRAAKSLATKGYRADTKVAEAAAFLDAARAHVARMETDIGRTAIRAPFAGRLEKRIVELGDYLKIGDPVAEIVDLDPILVVGAISEREVDHVRPGQTAQATLISGLVVSGVIRFIATVANPATRTFRFEVEVANADDDIRDGVTSQIRVPAVAEPAHFLSPALLTLDDNGALGVKGVDAANTVVFYPIRILSDRAGGIWVDGLPGTVRLITVGHEFVRAGQTVTAVPDARGSAS